MDTTPNDYRITIVRGQTWSRVFAVTKNGSPWNLTGATGFLTIRKEASASSPIILQLTQTGGLTFGNGTFTVTITAQQADIPPGVYTYDLWINTIADGDTPIFLSRFTVEPSTTNV